MEAEDVCLAFAFDGAQLDPRHDPNTEIQPGGDRLGNTVQCVMIGERDRAEPDPFRFANDVRGRSRAIGSRRVRVQIDEGLVRTGNP